MSVHCYQHNYGQVYDYLGEICVDGDMGLAMAIMIHAPWWSDNPISLQGDGVVWLEVEPDDEEAA